MKRTIQRSLLIMPVNVPRFLEKAHQRGADAILLDLEDSVPLAEKEKARRAVRESIGLVGRGGADVLARVNNDSALIQDDLEASVYPGLHGVFLPKVESPDQVTALDDDVRRLELDRGMTPGRLRLSIHVESPKGVLHMQEIAAASPRIESMSLGTDDYCLSMGIQPSVDGAELFFPLSVMAVVCRAAGICPMGVAGSVADFSDAQAFRNAAERARALGFFGAYCIHPGQVSILNDVFTPSAESVQTARRIIEAFDRASAEGRGSTSLDGRMIDRPICNQARQIVELADAIADKEAFMAGSGVS
jgi:citrate lyase subunit beta/citryl-CoA lyase